MYFVLLSNVLHPLEFYFEQLNIFYIFCSNEGTQMKHRKIIPDS